MNMTMGTVVAALLLAVPAAAQRPGPGSPDGPGRARGRDVGGAPPLERSVGLALEGRDSLGLSGEQVQQLEALRTEIRDETTALRDQMRELREEALGDRGAVRERMAEFQERARELREGQRGRFDDILSQEQRDRLGELMRRSGPRRPDGRGRGGARGRGFRPGAGPDPGGTGGGRPLLGAVGRRFGGGGSEMRAYLQGLRDGLSAGARFRGRRGRPTFGPGR